MAGSAEWSRAIRELLERHELTLRGAAIRAQRPALRTYLADWLQGQIPTYKTAVAFLQHFPREEAIECLRAGGFPVPEEWRDQSADGVVRVEIALKGAENLSDYSKERILELVKQEVERTRKEREGKA